MNILRRELAMLRSSTLLWMLALSGVVLMYLSIYPTFARDADLTKRLFDAFPPAFRDAFSIDVNTLLSFLGFFAFTFTNITLIASIHAAYAGVTLLSRESRSKTTDFLFSKPRSRASIFVQKVLAGLLVILLVWLVLVGVSFGLARAFGAGEFSLRDYLLLMVALLVVQLWFYVAGLFMTQLLPRLKSTIPATLAVTFGFFMVSMLAAILGDERFRYFSPFRFFNYVDIAAGRGYEPVYLIIAGVSACIMLGATYVLYTRRDTRAVA